MNYYIILLYFEQKTATDFVYEYKNVNAVKSKKYVRSEYLHVLHMLNSVLIQLLKFTFIDLHSPLMCQTVPESIHGFLK